MCANFYIWFGISRKIFTLCVAKNSQECMENSLTSKSILRFSRSSEKTQGVEALGMRVEWTWCSLEMGMGMCIATREWERIGINIPTDLYSVVTLAA